MLERASAALSPLAGNGYLAYEVADVPLPELDAIETPRPAQRLRIRAIRTLAS